MLSKEFEVNKSNQFTVVYNNMLRDKNLSLKSIGLLCKILSLPPDWDFSFNGLVAICKESKAAVRSSINELKEYGYIDVLKQQDERGLFTYKYKVFDLPQQDVVDKNNPAPDFPAMDNPTMENQQQYNHNQYNHNKYDEFDKSISNGNSLFLNELIKSKYITMEDADLESYKKLFNEVKMEYSKEDIYTSIHYVTKRIKLNKEKDEDGNIIENKFGYFNNALRNNLEHLQHMKEDIKLFDYSDEELDELLMSRINRER